MKSKRQSTVEPVFGSLLNYYGMRKVNTKGIKQANKIMLTAATAYNLKKLLKFSKIQFGKAAEAAVCFYSSVFNDILMILSRFKQLSFVKQNFQL